jgi:peptide deformylase
MVTQRLRRLARDMLETMYAASGIGLAAPQAGTQQRVIVVDVGENPIHW